MQINDYIVIQICDTQFDDDGIGCCAGSVYRELVCDGGGDL